MKEENQNTEVIEDGKRTRSKSGSGSKRRYKTGENGDVTLVPGDESEGNEVQGGGDEGGSQGNEGGRGGDKGERKQNLLESIRARRNERNPEIVGGEDKTPGREVSSGSGEGGVDGGHVGGQSGASAGADSGSTGDEGKSGDGDDSSDDNNKSSQTNRERVKPTVGGVKPPKLPHSQKQVTQIPKMVELLSPKESKELLPKVEDALSVAFKHMDEMIGYTTKGKEPTDILIWKTIDKTDINVIAKAFVEAGQKSTFVASAVRGVADKYTKLQLGIIFLPRLIMTVQNYVVNGFMNPFGGK